ncbi:MAG: hypothetical protein PHN82_08980 [bacterium]|nr:hypothetical protein [bacterium]
MDLYLLKFPYRKILEPIARRLEWLDPDALSYAAVGAAAATGWCFYRAADRPALLVWAVLLTLLRMTLNTLDGVIAIRRGNLSLRGEIVNALPDRYSDLLVVAGVALSPLCRGWLGLAALCSMVLVSYTGMLGRALGVSWQHHGPLGKVERLIILMVFALIQFVTLRGGSRAAWFGIEATPMEWAMGLFVLLGQVTVARRLGGQLREIDRKEALERLDPARNAGEAIVVYDSATGNTRAVAEEIARGLGCAATPVSEAGAAAGYGLVVLGSPNIRKSPSEGMRRFQAGAAARPKRVAVFATFGMPVWGQLSAPACLRGMARAWGMKPCARFSCPGLHRKYKTYRGRPNEADLARAFSFGLGLSRLIGRGKQ